MTFALPSNRLLNLGVFATTVLTIAAVLYMEHVMLLAPCGLCITQRIFVVLCGIVCLVAAIHNPGGRARDKTQDQQKATRAQRAYGLTAAAMCIFGSYFAIRQIWLQHLPEDQVPACGPGLTYIYQNFPFAEVLDFLLKGDGNCAEVQFRLFGLLTIPEMSLLAFAALFTVCIFMAFRKTEPY